MAQPNVRDLVVAGPLANVSVAYKNQSYIADKVFPLIDNVAPKAKIARYLKGAWFRDEAGIRGPGTRAKRGGYPIDLISVNTKEYAYAKEVTDEDRRNVRVSGGPPLSPDQDAIEFCVDKIDIKKERRTADLIFAADWSAAGAGGEDAAGLWAAGDSNTFIVDVETRIETIRSNTGFRPNTLVLCGSTLAQCKMESTVLDRIKYTQRGVVTPDLLAALFGLQEVLIGDAIYSTAVEALDGSDFTSKNIWEKNTGKGSAFLFYAPPSPGLKKPSAGYQCRVAGEGGLGRRTTTWREAAEHQDVYEVAEETDILVTGADLGFLWNDTITT